MTTFRSVAACVEVSIKGQVVAGTGEMFNILHFQTQSDPPAAGDVTACMNLVDTWVRNVYTLNFSADIQVTEIRAKSLATATAPFDFITVTYQGAQTNADELDHAPLMLLHGGLTDRHMAGKFYAFPPGGSQAQTGFPSAYYTNMTGALINLRTNANIAGFALAVASRDRGVCYAVRSIGHTNRLTVQKRRRLGFGR